MLKKHFNVVIETNPFAGLISVVNHYLNKSFLKILLTLFYINT